MFPAHRTTAGLLLLAELSAAELEDVYAAERYAERHDEQWDYIAAAGPRLTKCKKQGRAQQRSDYRTRRGQKNWREVGHGYASSRQRRLEGRCLSPRLVVP